MIRVIVGPSCAGKSTYAWRMARLGEVVIDFDAMARALGSERSHWAPPQVYECARAARDGAIARVLKRRLDAWVIHSRPTAEQMEAYRAAGASFVLMDPGIDECLRRCEADGRPPGTADRIRDWYERPPDVAADWRVR